MCFNTAEEHYKSNPKPTPFQVLMLPVNLFPAAFPPRRKEIASPGFAKSGTEEEKGEKTKRSGTILPLFELQRPWGRRGGDLPCRC